MFSGWARDAERFTMARNWINQAPICRKEKVSFHHEGEDVLRCNLIKGKKECRASHCPKTGESHE